MKACIQNTTDKIIVLKDGKAKSEMKFLNSNKRKIAKCIVDNCLIVDGIRCDFLIRDHNNIEHFVELKGSDIEHACNQIAKTIELISHDPYKGAKHSFIVSSVCPLASTKLQLKKIHFKKKYASGLIVKNRECIHVIG